METKELDNLSKDELMKRIKTKCAKEVNAIKIIGYLALAILVYGLVDYWWGKGMELSYSGLPAIVVLWCFIEVWWKQRMSKCDDAKKMVSLHENYIKYNLAIDVIALVLFVVLSYYFFKDINPDVMPLALTVLIVGLWVALFCWILWRLFKQRKNLSNPEVDRLKELEEKV